MTSGAGAPVSTSSASPPALRTKSRTQAAASRTSAACAGSALTLGMRMSSESSSSQAWSTARDSTRVGQSPRWQGDSAPADSSWAGRSRGRAACWGSSRLAHSRCCPAIALIVILATRDGTGTPHGVCSPAPVRLLLFVAYVQRDGPGTHCSSTPTSVTCGESLDPRPWLAAGLVLVAVSVAGTIAAHRRSRIRSATGADTDRLGELWEALTAEASYTPYPAHPFAPVLLTDNTVLVADDDEAVIGTLYLTTANQGFGFVFGVYVVPEARRRGDRRGARPRRRADPARRRQAVPRPRRRHRERGRPGALREARLRRPGPNAAGRCRRPAGLIRTVAA